jgi:hypothetical protein
VLPPEPVRVLLPEREQGREPVRVQGPVRVQVLPVSPEPLLLREL